MIGSLSTDLSNALRKIMGSALVDKKAVKELARDIQRALLQADVNVKLVFELTKKIEDRALSEELPKGLSKRDQLVKIVYDELVKFVGAEPQSLKLKDKGQSIVLLVGIQGGGKTTAVCKLAKHFQKQGRKPALICTDTFRPAAYEQLRQLAQKINVPVHGDAKEMDYIKLVEDGLKKFKEGFDVIIVDSEGRHKLDKTLMEDITKLSDMLQPDEKLLVLDATIGQQAGEQAKAFMESCGVTGIILSKLDGSARGGGALSAVASIGAPIKFIGTGEKVEDLEPFNPKRFISRILGMGDLESLLERAERITKEEQPRSMDHIMEGRLTLDDVLEQIEMMNKMGPLKQVMQMIPGGMNIPKELLDSSGDRLKKFKTIIHSMNKKEREDPGVMNAARMKRVADGSGTSMSEVKELLKYYDQTKKLLKMVKGGKRLPGGLNKMMKGLKGGMAG